MMNIVGCMRDLVIFSNGQNHLNDE